MLDDLSTPAAPASQGSAPPPSSEARPTLGQELEPPSPVVPHASMLAAYLQLPDPMLLEWFRDHPAARACLSERERAHAAGILAGTVAPRLDVKTPRSRRTRSLLELRMANCAEYLRERLQRGDHQTAIVSRQVAEIRASMRAAQEASQDDGTEAVIASIEFDTLSLGATVTLDGTGYRVNVITADGLGPTYHLLGKRGGAASISPPTFANSSAGLWSAWIGQRHSPSARLRFFQRTEDGRFVEVPSTAAVRR